MIDTATIERYMRDANPVPHVDDVDPDEFARFVATADARRAAIVQASTKHEATEPRPTTPQPLRRRRAWAFAAAFILILTSISITVLVLRSDEAPVTDEPAPPTTIAETTPEQETDEGAPLPEIEQLNWTRVAIDAVAFGGADFVNVQDVTVGGPGLVAVGWGVDVGGAADAMVWTSPDGYTWSRIPHVESIFSTDSEHWEMRSVTASGPGLVAVGCQHPGMGLPGEQAALVWTSPDGITWSRVAHHEMFDGGDMYGITEGGPGLIAVGEDRWGAAAWISPDGATWTQADIPTLDNEHSVMGGVTVGGPGLVAVGVSGENAAVWTSRDGTAWSRVPHDETVFGGVGHQAMSSVTAGGPGLVAVGDDHGRAAVWTSTDGYIWQRVPHDIEVFGVEILPQWDAHSIRDHYMGDGPMKAVIATDSGLVAVGTFIVGADPGGDPLSQATVWTSRDGTTWSRIPYTETDPATEALATPPHMVINSVAEGGPGLIAVGTYARSDHFYDVPFQGAAWVAQP